MYFGPKANKDKNKIVAEIIEFTNKAVRELLVISLEAI